MRLRVPGAKFLGTCNPEGPDHKVKSRTDRQAGASPQLPRPTSSALFDNPSLSEEYLEQAPHPVQRLGVPP